MPEPPPAVANRSAAFRRVRRVTAAAVGVAAALAGIFTALAAGSTHPRRAAPATTPAPATPAKAVVAPVPPLVELHRTAPPPPASPAPAPAPLPAPAASPVVVSGGS